MNRMVQDFLHQEHLDWRDLDLGEIVAAYNREAEAALQPRATGGEPRSSLEMLPTYLDSRRLQLREKKAVVIDAGGSNLRTALVEFPEAGPPRLSGLQRSSMPGSDSYVDHDLFFERLAAQVGPLVRSDLPLGVCFSYSFDSQPNLDGRLNHWSKEIQAPEIVGKLVGEGLLHALERLKYQQPRQLILLNDASATLLTGLACHRQRRYEDGLGYILGTGINLAYSEDIKALTLPAGSGHQRMIFNTESGNFSRIPCGSADLLLDQNSSDPGCYRLEKMCSGRYFGELVRQTLLLAAKQALVGLGLRQVLEKGALCEPFSLSSKIANDYLYNPWEPGLLADCLEHDQDRERVYYLVDALLERAAALSATVAAAAILRSAGGRSPLRPLALVIDGSSYYNYYQFADRFNLWLKRALKTSADGRRYVERIAVDQAPIIGAAVAALTQQNW